MSLQCQQISEFQIECNGSYYKLQKKDHTLYYYVIDCVIVITLFLFGCGLLKYYSNLEHRDKNSLKKSISVYIDKSYESLYARYTLLLVFSVLFLMNQKGFNQFNWIECIFDYFVNPFVYSINIVVAILALPTIFTSVAKGVLKDSFRKTNISSNDGDDDGVTMEKLEMYGSTKK